MTIRTGRVLTTVMAVVVGLFVLGSIFVQQQTASGPLVQFISSIGHTLVSWAAILAAFALLLGLFNVVTVHARNVATPNRQAIYSGVLLAALAVTLLVGLWGGPDAAGSRFIFDYVLNPLEATVFALLALFMATAAFRAFRIRNLETLFFVLFAVIVLLGQVPLGIYLWSEFPVIKDWVLNVPALAGVRGILLGVALGTIVTGLRVLLGSDRPYTD